ncbi:MAG: hypothetical protein CBC09_08605 [Cellvibrionales bacterium TMED49]|nr:hypothetical protein [Porticoccaceae bacterium]OUU35964.1 MAG: hypothetical protein CBC09_08605 [Cellvibrionales bacterium TMED49]
MDKKYEINQKSLQNGQIVLYQRPNAKKPKWQCRLSFPQKSGFTRMTTGHMDEVDAIAFAKDKWLEFYAKLKNNETIETKSKKLITAVNHYLQNLKDTGRVGEKRIEEEQRFLETYFCTFMKDKKLSDVTKGAVNQFVDWRVKNYKKIRYKNSNISKKPSENYMRKNVLTIRKFYNWCTDQGWCKEIRDFDLPKQKINRRPHFDDADYLKLSRNLREHEKEGKTAEGGYKWRERFLLRNYVLILANTGLRSGEARNLKWKDVTSQERLEDGKVVKDILLNVDGKTGSRQVVANPNVKSPLENLYRNREEELKSRPNKNEPVFANRKGEEIKSFKKSFEHLLTKYDLLHDNKGDKRTIYSLRHTYATYRINEGVSITDLSNNMGTSVKMIEQHYYHALNARRAEEITKMKNAKSKHKVEEDLPWF